MDYALPTPWFSPRPFTSPWRDEARGDDRRRGRRRPDPMLMEADGPGPDERRGPRGGHGHGRHDDDRAHLPRSRRVSISAMAVLAFNGATRSCHLFFA